jgi:ParB family chromosome partitioning protein
MPRQHHDLKCETEYYQAVEEGLKNFELRKNDRDYQVHDIINLHEIVRGVKTGRILHPKEIIYILNGGTYGLDKEYCILGLKDF